MADDPTALTRRLLAAGPQLAADGWTLGDAALGFVLGEVAAGRRHVLECGSGRSTVVVARLLRELGGGHVWALEHEAEFASRTRALLAAEGLDAVATVLTAPLRPHRIAADCGWYDGAALERLPSRAIELLLVDGPPAPADRPRNARSRFPALPLLAPFMAPAATVVCDDVHRPGERWALHRWRRDLGVALVPRAEGFAVGRLPRRTAVFRVRARLARARPAGARVPAVRPRGVRHTLGLE